MYKDNPELLATAIDTIFDKPKHLFWTGRVMDLLFDGFNVNCTHEQFEAKQTCKVYKNDIQNVFHYDSMIYQFATLRHVGGFFLLNT